MADSNPWSSEKTPTSSGSSEGFHASSRTHEAEPPIVEPRPLRPVNDAPSLRIPSWMDELLGAESYGAPRVFDLFTMLAITLAFACLFAILRLMAPLMRSELDQVAICLGTFVTGIAIAQMVLFGGNKPRIASVVAGPFVWILILVGLNLPYAAVWQMSWFYVGGLCSSILGIPAGYLGGAMVAGVFLLADFFRQRFLNHEPSVPSRNDDDIFSDREPPA